MYKPEYSVGRSTLFDDHVNWRIGEGGQNRHLPQSPVFLQNQLWTLLGSAAVLARRGLHAMAEWTGIGT